MADSPEVHAARVQNGIAVLDARVPDWRDRIDLATLDLASMDTCVVGQVFRDHPLRSEWGAWSAGMNSLLGTTDYDEAVEHGFDAAGEENYILLTEAWETAILNMMVSA